MYQSTFFGQAAGNAVASCDIVPTARVLVLLTDGRVDSYQVRSSCRRSQCSGRSM
jgi:hypothetical protein